MEYNNLGVSNLNVSKIGFGCWAIGGSWGSTDDKQSISTIRKAIDLGINFFDTADIYGFGHSETLLGKALGKKRKDVIIATKVGLAWDDHGCMFKACTRQHILNALDASLKRLNTDYIDLYQIHWPDTNTPFEVTMNVMDSLVKSGKVRYIGVSNFTVKQIRECMKTRAIHSLQPPYNMLMREAEKTLLPYCRRNGVGVIAYGSLAYGLLTGKFNNETTFADNDWRSGKLFSDPGDWQYHINIFQGKQFQRNIRIIEKLKKISKKYDKSVGQLAIAWVLSNPSISSALVGAKNIDQLEENLKGQGWTIEKEDLSRINAVLGKH